MFKIHVSEFLIDPDLQSMMDAATSMGMFCGNVIRPLLNEESVLICTVVLPGICIGAGVGIAQLISNVLRCYFCDMMI